MCVCVCVSNRECMYIERVLRPKLDAHNKKEKEKIEIINRRTRRTTLKHKTVRVCDGVVKLPLWINIYTSEAQNADTNESQTETKRNSNTTPSTHLCRRRTQTGNTTIVVGVSTVGRSVVGITFHLDIFTYTAKSSTCCDWLSMPHVHIHHNKMQSTVIFLFWLTTHNSQLRFEKRLLTRTPLAHTYGINGEKRQQRLSAFYLCVRRKKKNPTENSKNYYYYRQTHNETTAKADANEWVKPKETRKKMCLKLLLPGILRNRWLIIITIIK